MDPFMHHCGVNTNVKINATCVLASLLVHCLLVFSSYAPPTLAQPVEPSHASQRLLAASAAHSLIVDYMAIAAADCCAEFGARTAPADEHFPAQLSVSLSASLLAHANNPPRHSGSLSGYQVRSVLSWASRTPHAQESRGPENPHDAQAKRPTPSEGSEPLGGTRRTALGTEHLSVGRTAVPQPGPAPRRRRIAREQCRDAYAAPP